MGDELGRVWAVDPDLGENSRISFELKGQSAFRIDSSGKIILNQPLDRENTPFYQFVAVAFDHGKNPGPRSASATVTVHVCA